MNDPKAIELLNQPGLNFTQRLRNLIAGPLSTQPVLFILDDFEQNLEASGSGHISKSVPLEILKSLLTAIRETNSESRVIVTSRYKFPLPSPLRLREEGLESLRGGELDKKLTRLVAFNLSSSIKEKTRERARALGAGNPRLLEWLNKVLVDGATDATLIMDAMEREAERFRENVLLRELLSQLSVECRRMIALTSIYELPFDRQAIAAAVNNPIDPHLGRAVSLGLIEGGTDPATGESRYFVSRIALPLVEQETTAEEMVEAARRAAKHLHQTRWQSGSGFGLEEALEIFRLALAAREQGITAEIGGRIARRLVNSNRYREAEALCQVALNLGEDHRLLVALARAQVVLGRTTEARRNYERALSLCPDSNVSEKSGIIFYLATLVAQQGDVKRALELWQQSFEVDEQIGNVQGKAATLHQMAGVIEQQGDVKRALELWQQSLALNEQIGDVKGKAATLHNMAWVIAQQGDVKRALDLWQQSLALSEQIGDVKGKAATLSMMAGVIARQGDVKRALDLWQQSLALLEQIGDVKGKAATLSNMGWLAAKNEDFDEARRLFFEAGKSLAAIRAWPDLITVLSNLSALPIEGAPGFLAQAAWLTIRVESPVETALSLTAAMLEKLGTEHEMAPLLAAVAFYIIRTRGQHHPEQEKLINYGMNMLGACAAARKIERQDQFQEWFTSEGLNDPNRFMPTLSSALEAMVGEEEWLFDRRLFKE